MNRAAGGRRVIAAVAAAFTVLAGAAWWAPIGSTLSVAEDPCDLAASFFCRFGPLAPELEGDIYLTKDLSPASATAEDMPPVDVCAFGCA
jgi:hypothetical protein